ncbi:MAG: hypothetical protein ABF630_09490 [Liquorilactobacillus sp.]
MTIGEYSTRMLAFNLSQIDEVAARRDLAWSIMIAQSVDKDGKSPFKDFKDFFDYQKELDDVYMPTQREEDMNPTLVRIAKRVQEYHKLKGG